MRLGDGRLVRFQDHLGAVIVDMERSEDQDESGEGLEMEQTQTIYTGHKQMSPNTHLVEKSA